MSTSQSGSQEVKSVWFSHLPKWNNSIFTCRGITRLTSLENIIKKQNKMSNLFFYIGAKQHNLQLINRYYDILQISWICAPHFLTLWPPTPTCVSIYLGIQFRNMCMTLIMVMEFMMIWKGWLNWAERWQIKFNNVKWGVLNLLVGWEEDV